MKILTAIWLSLGAAILIAFGIAFGALLGGTIVYFIWPFAIPTAFPGLVTSGVLAAKLPWWSAVCLTWLMGLLVKSVLVNKKEKE